MQLSMTVLRCPDKIAPEARTVSGGEYHIGRGPDVDWVLPDPDRLLSKRHFAVAFRGGAWHVADTSTNGTFLNSDGEAIGRGVTRGLRDGDRLRLGAYEIEVRLIEQPAASSGFGAGTGGMRAMSGGAMSCGGSSSPFDDPLGDDPFAPAPPPRRPFDEPAYPEHGLPQTNAQLPHDFDPLAPDREDPLFGEGFRGPVQSDHSSLLEDAIIPPPVTGHAPLNAGGIIPGDSLLPDDWDLELSGLAPPEPVAKPPEPFTPPPVTRAPPPVENRPPPPVSPPITAPPIAAPVVRQRTARPAPPPPEPPPPALLPANPFDEMDPPEEPVPVPAPIMARTPEPVPALSPFHEPLDEPVAPPVRQPPRPAPVQRDVAPVQRDVAPAPAQRDAPPAASNDALLAAFFAGAGLAGSVPADPVAMMKGLGVAFRAMISGLRAVLIARATIKSEFRIEQTMIRAHGNNPLKFSANDDDALTALLGIGRRTDMTPAAAVEDSLRDIRMHEVAVMAALQVAVRVMMDEISPDKVRAGTDQGGLAVLPAQRKARAWDAFEARHNATVRALADDFDSVFGKAFARAYERALDEISTRDKR